MSCSNNLNNKTLILGLWKSTYEGQDISIEFVDSSTIIFDYGSFGSKLKKYYSIENNILVVEGINHSIIKELNKTTLDLRPIRTEIKADIDLIHAVTFSRSISSKNE